MAQIIEHLCIAHAEPLLDVLIRLSVAGNANFLPEAWAALLGLANDDSVLSGWLARLKDYLPAILDDLTDLDQWMTVSRFNGRVRSVLAPDHLALHLVRLVKEAYAAGAGVNEALGLLRQMFDTLPPLLHGTCGWVRTALANCGPAASPLAELVEAHGQRILLSVPEIKASCKGPSYELIGWIDP